MSDEHDGLGIGNLELGAATRIRAVAHVIYPNHVIARFGKFGAVEIARAARQFALFRSPQPANLKFLTLTALRANIIRPLRFLLFGVKVSFVHALEFTAKLRD